MILSEHPTIYLKLIGSNSYITICPLQKTKYNRKEREHSVKNGREGSESQAVSVITNSFDLGMWNGSSSFSSGMWDFTSSSEDTGGNN